MQLLRQTFFFLRHGETDWNRIGLVQGQVNMPLNGTGLAQALAARETLRDQNIGTICTSPLDRASLTADIIAAGLHVPVKEIDALRECRFGEREGHPKGAWYEAWRNGETPRGAERFSQFMERALDGINEALRNPGPVLIVAHGGIYWAIERFAGLARRERIPNGVPLFHCPPPKPLLPWQRAKIGGFAAA
ncbi:histidine phosphatase family protein [Dongia sp.]|uniref:histidine phosphatase family protein n=1 Tax=Dongia sp. TaxID=1977262 RepID=UPI0035AFFE1D